MKRSEAGPSQRTLRVGEEIRHALVEIMRQGHFRDPELQDLNVTVTEVRVSPDLKNATAYVIPLGGSALPGVVAALNRAAPYFRGQVARSVKLRHTPNVAFEADTSFDYAAKMDSLFRKAEVSRDLDPAAGGGDEAQGEVGAAEPDR